MLCDTTIKDRSQLSKIIERVLRRMLRRTNLEEIHKLILNVGHDTSLFPASDEVYNELPICCLYERKINYGKEKNLQ